MGLAVAGLDDKAILERVEKLASGDWSSFPPAQRAALHLARKITRTPWSIEQADVDVLTAHYGREHALDILYSICASNHMTRVADAYQLPLETENVFMFMKERDQKKEK